MLLHDVPDFSDLIEVTAREHLIDPGLVEKDYWIMMLCGACSNAASASNSRAALRFPKAFA